MAPQLRTKNKQCTLCKKSDNEDMIQCAGSCNDLFHLKCLEELKAVTREQSKNWKCEKCVVVAQIEETYKQLGNNASGNEKITTSVKSNSRTSKVNNESLRRKMELLKQEEKLLATQQSLVEEKRENIRRQLELVDLMSDDAESRAGDFEEEDGEPSVVKNERYKPEVSHSRHQESDMLPRQSKDLQGFPTHLQLAARNSMSKDLPFFSGRCEEWPLFLSAFETSTRVCGLNDYENLIRLQRCLKGKAKELVECQLTLPDQVPHIIETLKTIFGRPEQIILAQRERIRRLRSVKMEKLETIVEFSTAVANLCAVLTSTGMETNEKDRTLLFELLAKLPNELKLEWAKHKQSIADPGIHDFRQWINTIAINACSVETIFNFNNFGNAQSKMNRKQEDRMNFHGNDEDSRNEIKICLVCHGTCKQISNCKKFIKLSGNDRWTMVKNLKLCRQCLRVHKLNYPYICYKRIFCNKNGCKQKHHPLLHTERGENQVGVKDEAVCNHIFDQKEVMFRYLPVTLHNGDNSIDVLAFLDEGSSRTLLEEEYAQKLRANGPQTTLCLKWTGTMHRNELNSMSLNLDIRGIYDGSKIHKLNAVQTVKSLDLPVQTLNYKEMSHKYPYLRDLPVKSYENEKPRILIGLKNWNLAVPLRIREGKINQPIAAKCKLGWTVFATTGKESSRKEDYCNHHGCDSSNESTVDLHELIKNFFAIENMGVQVPPFHIASKEERFALETMETTTKNVGNRYETGLLFNEYIDRMKIPDSQSMAYKRLICLERRLERDPELRKTITEQMTKYHAQGYIRKLTSEELLIENKRVWYLPIFPVFNPNKPGKVRLVWDAAAEVNGVSLNSMLYKGPDLMTSIFDIQLRFRQRKVAICGDIREMFHRVRIRADDQNMQRFLWRDCDTTREPDIFIMQVMTFGATCSPSSAQFVKNLNAKRFQNEFPEAVNAIVHNHYVDDYLDSFDSEIEAIESVRQVKWIHAQGGFEIRGWKSNSVAVINAIEDKNVTTENSVNMQIVPSAMSAPAEKVLGMWWLLESDEFTYSLKFNKGNKEILSGDRRPTKREVTRVLMSVYDPLGLIAHYLNRLKIILQEIWRTKIDWDETIMDAQFEKWIDWINVLPQVEKIRIPRAYVKTASDYQNSDIQLHIFADGGKDGSAAVAYLRIKTDREVYCALVGAKTKVAPLKLTSVPKLELIAAQIGARFGKSIMEALSVNINKNIYWTDSKVVLDWIRSDARRIKGQFIAFRAAEIQESTKVKDWRYCPSKLNVADIATKSEKSIKFDIRDHWFQGPNFLYKDEEKWPKDLTSNNRSREEDTTEVVAMVHHETVNLVEISRFSKWEKLQRTVAFVYKFTEILRKKIHGNQEPQGLLLTGEKMKKAENLLFRIAQNEAYSKEIFQLKNDVKSTIEKSSTLHSWSPYLDQNFVLRVRGRIDAATCISTETKRPIILPRNHPITNLLVRYYHEKFYHINHETACNEIRQKYAIPKLRQVLRKVRKDCQLCKIKNAKPVPPEMGALPEARLAAYTRPFTYTGVDYFGPMNVVVGRKVFKRYGCLFTCLTTRAVHIEVAHSLDTASFIICYQNFINRRGQVRKLYSDCGTNFVGAERLLKEELKAINKLEIANEFTSSELEWHFNPSAAPHMGGCWERLVKSVKAALYAISSCRNPTEQVLQSYLIEVENMVNSRPLTYLPIDSEASEALTPNHFLLGSSSGVKPIGSFSDDVKILKENYLTSQLYARQFWKRFVVEYMPTLTRRLKWCKPTEPLKEGDIVIVVDKDSPRNSWPKGKIMKAHKGKDDQIRSATVQTSTGIYTRPAIKLAKLDLDCTSSFHSSTDVPQQISENSKYRGG